jgi:large subunit ribosomal protein L34e
MVSGKHKSRTMRKVFVRTTSKTKVQYRKRKMDTKKCASCGKQLSGVPKLTRSKFKNLPKTKKRPSRPYGGVLCSKCMRKKIKESL